MRHTLILTLLFFVFLSYVTLAQGLGIDSNLLRDIASGHQLLAQYTESLSGKIEISRGSSDTEPLDISSSRRLLFFRDNESLRLEYINPRKGTEVFPGHEKNDITEVFMKTKEHNFTFSAVASAGVPYGNLLRSTVLSEGQNITLDADFYNNINALFEPCVFMGAKVIDLLQDEIGTVENRKYNDIADALWISSSKKMDSDGNVSVWTVVLNPKQHYALLFCEMRVENSKTGFTAGSSGTISSQVTDDGKIFPKEIVVKGQTKMQAQGQPYELYTGERVLVDVLSTDAPDERLFTEESFEDMGRDYAVVDVLPNQTMAPGGYAVDAAPLASRMPYDPTEELATSDWTWTRLFFLSSGIILIVVACWRIYFRWRHPK